MRMLSKKNRIIYVNSLGTRRIKFDRRQFKFYLSKIENILQKTYMYQNRCVVHSPKIIPLIYNKHITFLNRILIRIQIQRLLDRHNFSRYILWVGSPMVAKFHDLFEPELTVYHAVDRYAKFEFVDGEKIMECEQVIAKKADVILCTADAIRNDLIDYNCAIYTIPHPVDYKHFFSAYGNGRVPEKMKKIKKPIIGYFGGLSERVNYSLIAKTANRYPDASVVLIGKKHFDGTVFENLPNIHLLGQQPFEELPLYLKQFSVCMIPYNVNELMEGVDPIKLREYMCLGKPVVSVDLPEIRKHRGLVYIGKDDDDFVEKISDALKENDPDMCGRRIRFAAENDWSIKINEISTIIERAIEKKKMNKENREQLDTFRTDFEHHKRI